MRVKIFVNTSGREDEEMEKKINDFIADKKVVNISTSTAATYSHSTGTQWRLFVTITYEG